MSRRARAAVVLSLLWAGAWTVGGAAIALYRLRQGGIAFDWARGPADVLRYVSKIGVGWGALGAVTGLAFSIALAFVGRSSPPSRLSAARVIGSGALAGLVCPAGILGVAALSSNAGIPVLGALVVLGGGAILGAVCALGTIALAGGAPSWATRGETAGKAT